ncbi:TAF11 [Candida jiufengensis]|uniref:TAF11 n=1 Tax=Candida jiufengensis TaxID=497108 RepID=UPI002224B6CF|nr:TAF11 [Candida jiufengensis]KAI5957097.1 TAF11 [Candida jiufengensis]
MENEDNSIEQTNLDSDHHQHESVSPEKNIESEESEEELEISSDSDSEISLDEDDEELIWRVFFNQLEKHREGINQSNEGLQTDGNTSDYDVDLETSDDDQSDVLSINSEELNLVNDPSLISRYKSLKEVNFDKNMSDEDQKRLLISNFTDAQMERFEAYRRSTINKPGVKKLCNAVIGHSVPQVIATVVAGVAKSFMGELITKSFEIQERDNKGKLLLDIEEKKLLKSKFLQDGKGSDLKQTPLKYEGDRKRPLQPCHVREAWRLYEEETSGTLK